MRVVGRSRRPSGLSLCQGLQGVQDPLPLLIDRGAIGVQETAELGHRCLQFDLKLVRRLSGDGEQGDHQRLVLEAVSWYRQVDLPFRVPVVVE